MELRLLLSPLLNAAKVIGRPISELGVTIVGTGAAGVACAHLLAEVGIGDIIGVDSRHSRLFRRGFTRVSNGSSIMAIRTIVRVARGNRGSRCPHWDSQARSY